MPAAAWRPWSYRRPSTAPRAATDTARTLLDVGHVAGAFAHLRPVELAAPLEARRPSVRSLTARVAELRPELPGLDAFARRTAPR
jgi:hypothetical protein